MYINLDSKEITSNINQNLLNIKKLKNCDYCKISKNNCSGNIGISRVEMPQVDTLDDLEKVIDLLESFDYKFSIENIQFRKNGKSRGSNGLREILPTQNNMSYNSIVNICKKYKKSVVPIIIVSPRDNNNKSYILDGHHRATAKMICCKNSIDKIIRIRGKSKYAKVETKRILKIIKTYIPEIFKKYNIL